MQRLTCQSYNKDKAGKHKASHTKRIFIADNTIFYTLGTQDNYLEKTTLIRSTIPPGSYKTSLDTSPPKILLLQCKQINKFKNWLDG